MAGVTTDHQVYQDFVFHNVEELDSFLLPAKTLASQNVRAEGALFYNLTDNLPYFSDGVAWVPLWAGTMDVAADLSVTAQDIALTADVDDITLTTADDFVVAASGMITSTSAGDIMSTSTGAGITMIGLGAGFILQGAGNSDIITGSGVLTIDAAGISFPKATVTQATNINTAVTINSPSGVITTQAASTAAHDTDTFVVNNNRILETSVVLACMVNYTGNLANNELPSIGVDGVTEGQFTIVILSAGTSALSGTLEISFIIV